MNTNEIPAAIDAALAKLGERRPELRSELRAYRAAIVGDTIDEADAAYAASAEAAAAFIAASVPPGADPLDVVRWHCGGDELAHILGQLRNVGTLPD